MKKSNFLFLFVVLGFSCGKEDQNIYIAPDAQPNLIAKAIVDINNSFGSDTQKGNKEVVNKNNLIANGIESFENENIEVLVFEANGHKYVAGYGPGEGNLVALSSQSTNKGLTNVNIIAENGESFKFVYDASTSNTKENDTQRSCAGTHYKLMMEIIESDGDLDFLCNITACHWQVYAAAAAHCAIRH